MTLSWAPARDSSGICSLVVLLVGRRRHLVCGRQIDPQLKALQQTVLLFRHLRMHDSPARGHPLNAAGFDDAFVAGVIAVAHAPVEQVGDGLETAMRMRRKTGDVVIRVIRSKRVEQQERIEVHQLRLPDHAHQFDPGAVAGGLAADDFFNSTNTHGITSGCAGWIALFNLSMCARNTLFGIPIHAVSAGDFNLADADEGKHLAQVTTDKIDCRACLSGAPPVVMTISPTARKPVER